MQGRHRQGAARGCIRDSERWGSIYGVISARQSCTQYASRENYQARGQGWWEGGTAMQTKRDWWSILVGGRSRMVGGGGQLQQREGDNQEASLFGHVICWHAHNHKHFDVGTILESMRRKTSIWDENWDLSRERGVGMGTLLSSVFQMNRLTTVQ